MIDSSRELLAGAGDRFFEAKSVKQSGGRLTIVAPSRGAEDDASFQSLGFIGQGARDWVAFAHRNDALIARVGEIESESVGDQQVWTVTITPEDVQYGGHGAEAATSINGKHYSAEDIARLRAGRILLNDPAPVEYNSRRFDHASLLEGFIRGTGVIQSVERCVLRDLYTHYQDEPMLYLRLARLAAIFHLKAGDVIEQVQTLALGPVSDGRVHVKFAGKRRKKYSNRDAHPIEFEGDCPLT